MTLGRLLIVCGFLCGLIVVLPATAERGIQLSENGTTIYSVFVAADAGAPEQHAAAELASFLAQVTGAEFHVRSPAAPVGERVIAVGPGAAKAVAAGIDLGGLGPDGIVIRTVGESLVLTGGPGAMRGDFVRGVHVSRRPRRHSLVDVRSQPNSSQADTCSRSTECSLRPAAGVSRDVLA